MSACATPGLFPACRWWVRRSNCFWRCCSRVRCALRSASYGRRRRLRWRCSASGCCRAWATRRYSLSYANRRRLEIARALALQPRLLLLDEPTAGMNETETAELQAVIAGLKVAGMSILLIEHKLDMVMRLCDQVVVMDDGAVIARGLPEQVRHDPAVIRAYLGDTHTGAMAVEIAA